MAMQSGRLIWRTAVVYLVSILTACPAGGKVARMQRWGFEPLPALLLCCHRLLLQLHLCLSAERSSCPVQVFLLGENRTSFDARHQKRASCGLMVTANKKR